MTPPCRRSTQKAMATRPTLSRKRHLESLETVTNQEGARSRPFLWQYGATTSSQMTSPRWRSAVLATSHEETVQDLTVPETGWYGLCFGYESSTELSPVDSDDDDVVLDIRTANELTTYARPLPLHGKKDAEPLASLEIGRLLFLHQNMRLSLRRSSGQRLGSSSRRRLAVCRLVFVRYEATYASTDDPFDSLDTPMKKPLVCGVCARSFSSVRNAQQHYRQMHATIGHSCGPSGAPQHQLANSIWTRPLKVIYLDDFLVVIDKPQDMPVQGSASGPTLQRSDLILPFGYATKADDERLSQQWPDYSKDPPRLDKSFRKPKMVHRLDAPTGGLLVLARTFRAEVALKQCFAERRCHKTYRALLHGKVSNDAGVCTSMIHGKPSESRYQVLRRLRSKIGRDGWLTEVNFMPVTGRTHQLRKHAARELGHSILGDRRYGPSIVLSSDAGMAGDGSTPMNPQKHLCLWAIGLTLPHPVSGEELKLELETPAWLTSVIQHELQLFDELVAGGED